MIHFSTVLRICDGIPLSVTRDASLDSFVAAAKKIIKLLVPKLAQYPKRVCLQDDSYTVHCVHSTVVAFVAVCEPTFSHLLVHSYLDELCKEFSMLYNSSVISAVKRPYAFTEFDSYMEKLRLKYGSPQFIASRGNLSELRAELGISPPTTLSVHDVAPPSPTQRYTQPQSHTTVDIPNGTLPRGSTTELAQVGVSKQLMPLSVAARVLMCVATALGALDMYRGLASLSQSSFEEYDGPSPSFGIGFIVECSLISSQVQVLRKYQRFRKLWSIVSLLLVALLSLLLLVQMREFWLSLLYVVTSACLTYFTLNRNFRKLQKFNV